MRMKTRKKHVHCRLIFNVVSYSSYNEQHIHFRYLISTSSISIVLNNTNIEYGRETKRKCSNDMLIENKRQRNKTRVIPKLSRDTFFSPLYTRVIQYSTFISIMPAALIVSVPTNIKMKSSCQRILTHHTPTTPASSYSPSDMINDVDYKVTKFSIIIFTHKYNYSNYFLSIRPH